MCVLVILVEVVPACVFVFGSRLARLYLCSFGEATLNLCILSGSLASFEPTEV